MIFLHKLFKTQTYKKRLEGLSSLKLLILNYDNKFREDLLRTFNFKLYGIERIIEDLEKNNLKSSKVVSFMQCLKWNKSDLQLAYNVKNFVDNDKLNQNPICSVMKRRKKEEYLIENQKRKELLDKFIDYTNQLENKIKDTIQDYKLISI